jgi:hypothetical protein
MLKPSKSFNLYNKNNLARFYRRVIRLGEFSPNCFIWATFCGSPNFGGSVFHGKSYLKGIYFAKKMFGLHFGRFFHKLIWSP